MTAGAGEIKAAFLDRDGVLNKPVVRDGKPYPPASVADFEIYEEAAGAVRRLRDMGFLVVVVTNQPDVARGAQTRTEIEAMHGRLRGALGIEDFYVCWHDDADGCDCRKPKPGLLRRAALDFGISLADSYMIGDRWRDVDCGHAAGCRTIFIDRGYSEKLRQEPDRRARDLAEAVGVIEEYVIEEEAHT
jgi:D-glycero-D-manno-heptose 1,7-bisphosphate phosphatase